MSTRLYFKDSLSSDTNEHPHISSNYLHLSPNQSTIGLKFDPERGFYMELDYEPLFDDTEKLRLTKELENSCKEITYLKYIGPSTSTPLFLQKMEKGVYALKNEGKVIISEFGVNLKVVVRADSLQSFNETVSALKNGELIKEKEELNQYENLMKSYSDACASNQRLENRVKNGTLEINRLSAEIKKIEHELQSSICYKIKFFLNGLLSNNNPKAKSKC